MWKEVTTTTIKIDVSTSGCKEGEVRERLGNSLGGPMYFDDQKENFVRLVLG
jgi:hypothetical protein